MRHTRVVAPIASLALAASLSACMTDFLGPSGGTIGPPSDGCGFYCVDLDITPTGQNLLLGDTVRLYGYTSRVQTPTFEWTAVTDNFVLMNGSAATNALTLPSYSGVVLKASAIGAAKLAGKVSGTTYTSDYNFQIADSSAMTALRIHVFNPTVKVGQSLYITSTIKDANGIQYRASPTWTSLDEAIAKLSPYTSPGNATVNAIKAGTVKIVAGFRSLRDTLVVTVIP